MASRIVVYDGGNDAFDEGARTAFKRRYGTMRRDAAKTTAILSADILEPFPDAGDCCPSFEMRLTGLVANGTDLLPEQQGEN